ncbi:MAG: aspartate aminotransferase family protein [Lachnospiraceae bacterium]|nr:aspartate aminotransferase family protein [Lachnospiraceae bacterium]
MSKNQEIIDKTEKYALHVYNRFPIAVDHGEGVRVWDADGKEYLDFMAGIAVYALGYHFPGYDEALIDQTKKILHTSNLYYHQPLADAAENVCKATGMDKVFFTNSGAEAIEGALKTARKYAYLKDGKNDHEIIAMKDSFHGRSVGALSVTGNAHYQDPFKPLMGGVRFAEYNHIDSVKEQVNDRTCAIIMETIQGEGGIFPADPAFIKEVRKICDEKDILLILDEIQCGMGRSGSLFAYDLYGVKPDVVTMAKALGCGVPVGAFAVNEKVAKNSLVPGDHGTTYGGNPFVLAAVNAVFDLFEKNDIVGHVQKTAPYLTKSLEDFKARHPEAVKARRGVGFIQGLAFDESVPVGQICTKALDKGLLIISASHNTLRFVPPLIITEKEIDEAMGILDEVLEELG